MSVCDLCELSKDFIFFWKIFFVCVFAFQFPFISCLPPGV